MDKIKKIVKFFFHKILLIIVPSIKVSSKYNYKILGETSDHYFVGYYDKDPFDYSYKYILCHKVVSNYSDMIEPLNAKIGLLEIKTNKFKELISTNAMNWQLGR